METRTTYRWPAFPEAGLYTFDTADLSRAWGRLHLGDAEPLPREAAVLQAWCLFHNGHFQEARDAGLQAGGAGITVANKAQAVVANALERHEPTRLQMFMSAATQAEHQARAEPANANAWYWHAYALGRYSQGISVAKALAQGLGTKVKNALERTIALSPRHVDAHVALGAFHAEVIDKVGPLIGSMTYGVRQETSLRMFELALGMHPDSVIGQIEYARALLMLKGENAAAQAQELYTRAAQASPQDATEWLDVELARAELRA